MIKVIDGIEFDTDWDELVGHWRSRRRPDLSAALYCKHGQHGEEPQLLSGDPVQRLWALWLGSGATYQLSEDEAFEWLVAPPSEECDHQAKLEQYFQERLTPGYDPERA